MVVFGGSVVLGYLAVEFLMGSAKKAGKPLETAIPPGPYRQTMHGDAERFQKRAVQSAATGAAIAAAYESGLKEFVLGATEKHGDRRASALVQDVAARAVPHVMNYLGGNRASSIDPSSIDHSTEPVANALPPAN